MTYLASNIGAEILPVAGLPALANSAGTRNGAAIDRLQSGAMANSLVLVANTGATTGSPTAQTYDLKIQDSADGATGWADLSGAAIAQKTTATAALVQCEVDLLPAKRYIRAVEVVAFTGGTTPATPAAADVILGGFDRLAV
ncbi:MAG: hypothetical protein FJ096_02405 [Deltaproteobacteria bacterium]|nr:hypothetical protein [Deltaproteobacteria bacterium]